MTARPAERGRAAGTFGAELVALARLAGPITVGQLAVMGSAVIDNVLAGHRGATVLGAVAVGAGLWILALMPVFGVLMAMQPIVSELDGAGRRQEAIPVFRQAVLAGLAIGVVMGLLLAFGGPALLDAFGTAPAIRPGAVAFLRAVAPGVPAVALFAASRGLSEGLSRTRPTMLIQIAGLVLLAPLGYALMYGVGSLPPLGARGSAIATAISAWVQSVAYLVWVRRSRGYGLDWSGGRWRPDPVLLRRLLRLGTPIAVSLGMEVGMFTASSLIAARLGAVAVAASQVALNVTSLLFMVPLGIALAATIRVGNALGREDPDGVGRAVRAGYALLGASVLFDGAVLLLARRSIVSLYTNDPAVVALGSSLLLIAVLTLLPDGIQVVSNGILRGLKDTRAPMWLTTISYWAVGVPAMAWLALGTSLGVRGAWLGITLGVACAGVLLGHRVRLRVTKASGRSPPEQEPALSPLQPVG